MIFIKRHLSSQLPVADVAPCHGKAKYIEEGTGWDPHLSPFQRIGEEKTKTKTTTIQKPKAKTKTKQRQRHRVERGKDKTYDD